MFSLSAVPSVTVVVPLHNARSTIARCLESIRRQTFQDFEVVLVDDGSSDGGSDIAGCYLTDTDRLVRQENAGVSRARNRGISESRAKYVAFLDADDEWSPGFLEAVTALAHRYPEAGIFATGYRTVFRKGRAVEITLTTPESDTQCLVRDYFRRALGGTLIWTGCIMIPRSVFTTVGAFPENVPIGEDLDLWGRISLRFSLAYDTRILSTYHRDVAGQVTARRVNDFGWLTEYPVHVRSLRAALDRMEVFSACRSDVEAYADSELLKYARQYAMAGECDWLPRATRDVKPSFRNRFRTRCLRSVRSRWILILAELLVCRLPTSRLFLLLRGGTRTSRGVLTRIQGKA